MRRVSGLLVAAAVLAACATKVAAGTPGAFTRVDPALVVESLDSVNEAELCVDLQVFGGTALSDDVLRASACASLLVADPEGGSIACHQRFDDCMAAPAAARPALNFGECDQQSSFAGFAATCPLTVGDLQRCVLGLAADHAALASVGGAYCDGSHAAPFSDERCLACCDLVSYVDAIMQGGIVPPRGGTPAWTCP